MRRNRLSVRSRITVGQKLPENWEEKVSNFRQFVSRRKEELAIQADRVFNMKEQLTQLELKAFLYEPLVTRKETSQFSLRAQSPGKSRSQWSSLREKQCKKENLPNGVVVYYHKKGWMDRDQMAVWGEKVWLPDLCPSSTEPLCSFSTVSGHILMKVFATPKLDKKQLPQGFLEAYNQDIAAIRHFC